MRTYAICYITCTNYLDSVVKKELCSQFITSQLALHEEKNTTSRSPLVISVWTSVSLSWARLMCYFIYFCVCICTYLFSCTSKTYSASEIREGIRSELEIQVAVSNLVSAGNWTLVFCKNSKCFWPLSQNIISRRYYKIKYIDEQLFKFCIIICHIYNTKGTKIK